MFNNLLNAALSAIPTQKVFLKKAIGTTTSDDGYIVTEYAEPIEILGSMQAVQEIDIQSLGLTMNKRIMRLHTKEKINGAVENMASDLIIYDDKVYQVITPTNWQPQDGWNRIYLVEIDK